MVFDGEFRVFGLGFGFLNIRGVSFECSCLGRGSASVVLLNG